MKSERRYFVESCGDWTNGFLSPFRELDLRFESPITFLVGENACGKSAMLAAIAELLELSWRGGSRQKSLAPKRRDALASVLRPSFVTCPPDSYFFRADLTVEFAELLEERRRDPELFGDPYESYGGRPLVEQSHGEGHLALLASRIGEGLYLFDEPEAALSPQRQLTFMSLLAQRVASSRAQFVIATHSPILVTMPESTILQIEGASIQKVSIEETTHYQITRQMLEHPQFFWRSHVRS